MKELIEYIGNRKILVYLGLMVGISLQFFGFGDSIFLTVPSLFIILKGIHLDNLPKPLWFRKMSTIIYFGHMYVVFFFSYVTSLFPIGSWKTYFIICCVVFAISSILLSISNVNKLNFLKLIYS